MPHPLSAASEEVGMSGPDVRSEVDPSWTGLNLVWSAELVLVQLFKTPMILILSSGDSPFVLQEQRFFDAWYS